MTANVNFYLSLAALLISAGGGVYFLSWWFRDGRRNRFLLLWAGSLGMLFWFKIPNILANAGITIVQQDFYKFFFVTLLMYLLAYMALMRGLLFFTKCPYGGLMSGFMYTWFIVAVFYFSLSFLMPGLELTYAPVWAGHVLFYVPAQLFILYELFRVSRRPDMALVPRAGIIFTGLGVILFLASSVLYIFVQTYSYPLEFWYLSAISAPSISLFQILGVTSLFYGLYAFSKTYFLKK